LRSIAIAVGWITAEVETGVGGPDSGVDAGADEQETAMNRNKKSIGFSKNDLMISPSAYSLRKAIHYASPQTT
jgi:hypothetical protein